VAVVSSFVALAAAMVYGGVGTAQLVLAVVSGTIYIMGRHH
jgi:hypothetical protein